MTAQIRAALTWAIVFATVACTAGPPAPTPPVPPPPASATASTPPPPTSEPPVSTTAPPTSAPSSLPPSLAGACWSRSPTDREVVALTFDAGGNDAGVAPILATLRRERVPATFFMTGRWAEVYPERAVAIASGFPVGNHTQTHADLTTLSRAAVTAEVVAAQRSLRRITGRDPRPLFRFPYGASNAQAIDTIHALGYGCIGWTVGSLGWRGTSSGVTVDAIVRAVHDGLAPGAIVLMHVGANPDDGSTLDADALPLVIRTIRAHGYGFVTLPEML
ncbi:MAG: polysaccharide deacetylase family protein [Planctomycetaceae bacterium]